MLLSGAEGADTLLSGAEGADTLLSGAEGADTRTRLPAESSRAGWYVEGTRLITCTQQEAVRDGYLNGSVHIIEAFVERERDISGTIRDSA